MRHARLTVLLGLLATALLTGCGASQQAAGAPESAALVPSDALAYVAIASDEGSEQWRQAQRLLDLVPLARDALTGAIRSELAAQDLNWEEDVAPALGPEVVVVVTAEQRPVILTRPESEAKLNALLAQSEQRFVRETVSGWTALAERRSDLAGYQAALDRGTLESDGAFAQALDALPAEALVRAWVDVSGLAEGLGAALEQSGDDLELGMESLSAALSADEEGLLLSMSMRSPEGGATSYEPEVFERVPGDAVAAVSFGGTQGMLDRLQGRVDLDEISAGLEGMLGVSLEGLVDALTGEGVLYVRPGGSMPEVTLALAPPDPAEARATVDRIVQTLAKQTGGSVEAVTEDGLEVRRLRTEGFTLSYASPDDETVVITTGPGGIREFRGGGPKLAESDAFTRAAAEVELEGRTTGFAYVDIDGLVPLVDGVTGGGGLPAEAREVLESVDSFILQSEGSGDTATLSGFVRVADR